MSDVYTETMTSPQVNSGQEMSDRMLAQVRADQARSYALAQESIQSAERINQLNLEQGNKSLELQKEIDARNFKYMVERQGVEDMRADTKFQRAVADARAAGLSPLAVLGNMSGSGNVISQASGINPVVPQQDPSALVNAYGNAIHSQSAMAGLKAELNAELLRTSSASDRIDKQSRYDAMLQRERLNAQYEQVKAGLESNEKIALEKIQAENERHRQDIDQLGKKLDKEERDTIARGYQQAGFQVRFVNASKEQIDRHNENAIRRDEDTATIYLKDAVIWSTSQNSGASAGAKIDAFGQGGAGADASVNTGSSYSENPVKIFEERLKQSRAKKGNEIWIYSPDGEKI